MRLQPLIIVTLVVLLVCTPACCAAERTDTTKALLVTYLYKDGKVTTLSSRVVYGYPPNYVAHRDILVDLKGKNGSVLKSFGIQDPRIVYHEEGADLLDEVEFTVLLPFSSDASSVTLSDGDSGTVMVTTDVSSAVSSFCANHPYDPQCAGGGKSTPTPIDIGIVLSAVAAASFFLKGRF